MPAHTMVHSAVLLGAKIQADASRLLRRERRRIFPEQTSTVKTRTRRQAPGHTIGKHHRRLGCKR